MKKLFQEPELDVLNFAAEDVIMDSDGWIPGENEGEKDEL